jgi:signal transduction histidine kinase
MKRMPNRTLLALLLTAAAIAVPCAAWYVAGSREVARQVAAFEAEPRRLARETAAQLAQKLKARLDALQDTEWRRPFYHYQNLYHNPKGAYAGASIVPSPLAEGPTDPFIYAYFQIDAAGRLSLPTFNAAVHEANFGDIETEQAIQRKLQPVVPASACAADLQRPQPHAPAPLLVTAQSVAPPDGETQPQPEPGRSIAPPSARGSSLPRQQARVERLQPEAWAQTAAANELYYALKNPEGVKLSAEVLDTLQRLPTPKTDVEIDVGPFIWCTVRIADRPTPVALRRVVTPHGVLVQGFVISLGALEESLRGSPLPVMLCPPGEPTAPPKYGYAMAFLPESGFDDGVAVAIEDTGWSIYVDVSRQLAEARAKAQRVRATFMQFFLGGMFAASIAGLCVVGLVWQSDRLARQRSQFAASAAHELRTPLAGLRMYSEMLAEGLGDPARRAEYARRVADESERLGRVVANVLGFTRLERGAVPIQASPGDLAAVVRDAVARQQPALETLGVTVLAEIAEKLPPVKFDADAIAQIVQNLLDNAEKHTRQSENRVIRVSLAGRDDRDGRVSSVELSVCDRGPGVARGLQRRLFRAFARGEQPDAPAGIGLGLVLVRMLAEAQGGCVSYRDGDGGGACFVVTLPACDPTGGLAESQSKTTSPS